MQESAKTSPLSRSPSVGRARTAPPGMTISTGASGSSSDGTVMERRPAVPLQVASPGREKLEVRKVTVVLVSWKPDRRRDTWFGVKGLGFRV